MFCDHLTPRVPLECRWEWLLPWEEECLLLVLLEWLHQWVHTIPYHTIPQGRSINQSIRLRERNSKGKSAADLKRFGLIICRNGNATRTHGPRNASRYGHATRTHGKRNASWHARRTGTYFYLFIYLLFFAPHLLSFSSLIPHSSWFCRHTFIQGMPPGGMPPMGRGVPPPGGRGQ